MGESVHLGQVVLPENVEFASTVQESDLEQSIASVLAPKIAQVEEEEEVLEGEEGEEGTEETPTEEGDSDE